MEFIEEYYIWFIIGGIILFMTLIGYIADKYSYIEKQKSKNKEKKNSIMLQKQNHITKKGEQFIKSIGDGKNLVLEECNINYPIDLEEVVEEKANEIVQNIEKIEETEISEKEDFANVGIGSYIMEKESPKEKIDTQEDKDINTPLENGVLNLDAYDKEAEEDLWKF